MKIISETSLTLYPRNPDGSDGLHADMQEYPIFVPEERKDFTLGELKEIVTEMEKVTLKVPIRWKVAHG